MSAELDALAETARNRGLKLVRSRVRTPGKTGFGKVGLVDPAGKPVLGMKDGAPTGEAAELEAYLRGQSLSDWSASIGVTPRRAKPKPSAKPTRPSKVAIPEPEPEPEPVVALRDARPGDAAALVRLMALLDHRADEAGVSERMEHLRDLGEAPLVATVGTDVVGLCGLHRMTTIHRDDPVGRITILVVAEAARGRGIGRLLVEEADRRLREAGCAILELTSNDRLTRAHAFYRHLGFERTGMRFARDLRR